MIFNGTTHDRIPGDATDGVLVNLGANNDVTVTGTVTANAGTGPFPVSDNGGSLTVDGSVSLAAAIPAGTNNIGDVDVVSLPAGTVAGSSSLPAGTNNIGDVDIASGPTGASALQSQGPAAHDAVITGNPIAIGMRANANEPTAVSADGDVVWGWADRFGRQVVISGHPSPEAPVTVNATASGDTTVISAPGAGVSIHVCKASVHNRDTANRVVSLRDGAGGTIRWRAEIASEGGGSLIDFGDRGWKLTANTALVVNLDAAGNCDVNVTEYYLAP
jgi:hypothetical protein